MNNSDEGFLGSWWHLLVLCILFAILYSSHSIAAPGDGKHLAYSFVISATVDELTDNKAAAIGAVILLGYAKEMTDPVFSINDMKLNVLGAVVGAFLKFRWEF